MLHFPLRIRTSSEMSCAVDMYVLYGGCLHISFVFANICFVRVFLRHSFANAKQSERSNYQLPRACCSPDWRASGSFMAKINYYGGMPNAQKLAAGWVHRLAYFFNVYTESNDPDFKFDDATISAYEEDPAFSAWVAGLAPNDRCVTRAKQLRKIVPKSRAP